MLAQTSAMMGMSLDSKAPKRSFSRIASIMEVLFEELAQTFMPEVRVVYSNSSLEPTFDCENEI